MASTTQDKRPSQVILFSHGRTACHLLERMLFSKQPNSTLLWHPAAPARPLQVQLFNEDSIAAGMPPATREPYVDQVNAGIKDWQESLTKASGENRVVFVHEHPQFLLNPDAALKLYKTRKAQPETLNNTDKTNFTLVPDSLLLHPETVAIITVRHPALTVPAAYKALTTMEKFGDSGTVSGNDGNLVIINNMGWQRQMYDYYVQNGGDVVVVDAEEYMSSPEYTRQLASRVGLDPSACIFEWKAATEEDKAKMHPMFLILQETLVNSTGLVPSKVRKGIDIDVEEQKWKQQFGLEAATYIRDIVDHVLPHYEYLQAHIFRTT